MGSQYWAEGIIFIIIFAVIVATPCFFIAILGSRMVNDIGNAPSQSAQIQKSACWKVFLAEVFSFALLTGFFYIFK